MSEANHNTGKNKDLPWEGKPRKAELDTEAENDVWEREAKRRAGVADVGTRMKPGKKSEENDTGEEMEEEDAEKSEGKKGPGPKGRRKRFISYRLVMSNLPFLLFLAALAVVYIYNGHYADKIVRDINRTSKELKELQYEYKTLKSEVMFRSKQSELAKAVAPFGLKELIAPPVVIVDSTKK